MRLCALQLTSFEELSVQVGQAAGDGVREPAAADPVVGLDAQVATQRALRTNVRTGERTREESKVRDKGGMKTDGEEKMRLASASLSGVDKLYRGSEEEN